MEKVKNLSIRKTITLYMGINLIICFFVAAIITHYADKWQQQIWWKYTDQEALIEEREWEQYSGSRSGIGRISNGDMSREDLFFSELSDALQTWSMLLIGSIGMIITVLLFYRNKIRLPLQELVYGSAMIANNDLDFTLTYTNRDELGTLCSEFEKMRSRLAENNQQMWKLVEQEKTLKAAIAHDIRSPLATLRGYQEMLLEFVPEDKLDKQRLIEILQSGMIQIDRLNGFAETMTRLSRLDNREPQYQQSRMSELADRINEAASVLAKGSGKEYQIITEPEDRELHLDQNFVLEVAENLISNALRYAFKEVVIELRADQNYLELIAADDGNGFQEAAEKVTKAYYHANPKDDLTHFGLGLYICSVYCEKHGGKLLIGNQHQGGAKVKALFHIK